MSLVPVGESGTEAGNDKLIYADKRVGVTLFPLSADGAMGQRKAGRRGMDELVRVG